METHQKVDGPTVPVPRRAVAAVALLVATGCLAVLALAIAGWAGAFDSDTKQRPPAVTSPPALNKSSDSFARIPQVVNAVQPSIVTVFTARDAGSGATGGGVGSGVIYRSDGVVLTNNHVVEGATRVEVAFADGRRVPGRVAATDSDTDLAVIRVDRKGLPAATFASGLPQVGALAIVLGSPLGFEKTVTAGIVSGLHRQIPGSASQTRALVDLIQTDAAISPGNSGGAIVDDSGRVLGISVAYVPPQQGAVAVGFAIPAATATRVADELLQHGRARHAYLGLQLAELTPQIAAELHVSTGGVLVYGVAAGGPAAQAGVRAGDVLTAVNNEKVTSVEELYAALRKYEPGQLASISHVRAGENHTAHVRIADQPS
jgi:S1-C subfamily serine protease